MPGFCLCCAEEIATNSGGITVGVCRLTTDLLKAASHEYGVREDSSLKASLSAYSLLSNYSLKFYR